MDRRLQFKDLTQHYPNYNGVKPLQGPAMGTSGSLYTSHALPITVDGVRCVDVELQNSSIFQEEIKGIVHLQNEKKTNCV